MKSGKIELSQEGTMVAPNNLSVNKTKKEGQHDVTFAEGGDGHMFGQQAAGPDKPGNTGKDPTGAPGPKFAAGGKTKMFEFHPAVPATAGQTGAR
jgi:hypothetical protein